MQERRFHQLFEVTILLKGAHALIECLVGMALFATSNQRLVQIADAIAGPKLAADPHDRLAELIAKLAGGFSADSQHFSALFLISHGIVNLVLVVALRMNKLWAYPISLVIFGLFIGLQLYRFSFTHSITLLVLTAFDAIVMWLVWHEYRLMRHPSPAK